MKYELRFLNIDANLIKNTLDSLDKNIIKQKVLLRWDSLHYKDKHIRVRDEGNGNVTLTLKTNLNSSQPISKTILVNDYFLTIDILKGIEVMLTGKITMLEITQQFEYEFGQKYQ